MQSSSPELHAQASGSEKDPRRRVHPPTGDLANTPVAGPAEKHELEATLESQSDADLDGGWRGRLTVAGAWLVQFSAIGVINSFGIYQSFYTLNYMSSTATSIISWVGSIQLFLELTTGPLGGHLVDRGHFRTVLACGSLLFLFSFFMLSLAHPNAFYEVLLPQGFGMGIGAGLVYIPTTSAVSARFRKWRGLAMGISGSGSSLGASVFSILLNQLLNSRAGFAWGTRAVAFICTFCLGLALVLIQQVPSVKLSGLSDPSHPPTVSEPARNSSISYLLCDPAYVIAVIAMVSICLGLWTPMFFIQLYAELHGISAGLAFYSLALLNFSGCFGRIVPNLLADRFGIYRIYVPVVLICGALCFGLLACGTPGGLVTISILYGFFSGGNISLFFPLIASLGSDPADIGKRLGFSGLPLGVALLVGPPISSALLKGNSDWSSCLAFAAIVQIAGAVLIACVCLLVSKDIRRWPGTRIVHGPLPEPNQR